MCGCLFQFIFLQHVGYTDRLCLNGLNCRKEHKIPIFIKFCQLVLANVYTMANSLVADPANLSYNVWEDFEDDGVLLGCMDEDDQPLTNNSQSSQVLETSKV